MTLTRRFADLALATKIVLLVGLLGVISIAITAYSLANMRGIDQQYRALINTEAQSALHIGDAALHLSDASRLVYAVLTEQEESSMRATLGDLAVLQSQFNEKLNQVGGLLPAKSQRLQAIAQESARAFKLAQDIINAAARWRGDRALLLIHEQFEPTLSALRQDMETLQKGSIRDFEAASVQLKQATTRTIVTTASAVALGLALVIALSAYVAISQISRPILQLTHTMQRLTDRHYGDTIAGTGRRDEVGTMATALQVFKDTMQRADRLVLEVAASAEARRLSEQLVDLTGAIPGAVFQMHVRPDGWRHCLFISDTAAELHGRPVAEMLALQGPVGSGYLAPDAAQIRQIHETFKNSVRTLQPLDIDTLVEHGGRQRWIKTLATARRAPDGGALFNGVWLDVTEQKLQAQALAEAKEVAERAANEKATFLATMSHEIRTPLNAILGLTQLALKDDLGAAQRERTEKMLRAGRHLLGIVNDILDFSKIDAGQMALEATDFTMTQLLADVQELYCERAIDKGLRLSVDIAYEVPVLLRGDPHRMAQILVNYVNNAIKFTDKGEVAIRVRAAQQDSGGVLLHCAVHDTGMGLTQAQQAGLFQAFHQGDASITRRFGGTGLGLAISRQLAMLMGGEVGVDSTPDKGSTFWFTARVQHGAARADSSQHTPDANPALDTAPLHGLRVLLVDDNELNRTVARGLLESGGMLVDTADHGAQAIATLEGAVDGHYAGVLMDMQMPVMDGLSATRALRQNPRFAALPIIAMTANATHQDIERTRASGMDDHLSKPVLEAALWHTLLRWLQPALAGSTLPSALGTSTAIDPVPLQELRQVFTPERLRTLVALFLHDCEDRVARIQEADAAADWSALQRETHNLSGSAGSFGLHQLGTLAQALNAAAGQQNLRAMPTLVAGIRQAALQGLPQLRALCEVLCENGTEPPG